MGTSFSVMVCANGPNLMNYEAYLTRAGTPNRLTRKQARNKTFLKNKKMRKLQRKVERELRNG